MLRVILIGVWVCVVALGSFILALRYPYRHSTTTASEAQAVMDYERTRVLDIPIIMGNALKGYIVAQFVYIVDHRAKEALGGTALDDYINDALFEKFYGSYTNAEQIDRVDVKMLKDELIKKINSRLPEPFLKSLIVAHFSYYTKEQIQKNKNINLPTIK